ncbi:NADH-quinone oxidoreductase subunit N, partial [Brasilonema bromeliae]|nr:hypothetical protein [Brasilonema bromeliae SPC951]
MSFDALVQYVAADAKSSIAGFLPELVLCVAIVLLLVVRVAGWRVRGDAYLISTIGALAALLVAVLDAREGSLFLPLVEKSPHSPRVGAELFTGMIVYDHFTQFWRILLAGFLVLFLRLTRLTGVPDDEDGPDIYSLVIGSTIGLMSMASANHVLMIFLAMELASVPTYILAGLNKGRRQASEAALKYAVYGAAASGVMIYGMSLLCGVLGSLHLPTMAERLAATLGDPALADRQTMLVLGGLFFAVGLAFKLATFPFHFWAPDVFEGATAEMGAFLSVASKAGALALTMRVALTFAGGPLVPEP